MNLNDEPVLIVDDDESVRDSLRALLLSAGYRVRAFASAKAVLETIDDEGGCLIADIRMPDMDGLELQSELVRRGCKLPVIIVTGHGDVPLAVRAMQAGAIDFIEKPYNDDALLVSVKRGLEQHRLTSETERERETRADLVKTLTPREREVLEHVIGGMPNKLVAFELGISPRTVEIHRAHLMEKTQAGSLPELVRIAFAAGVVPKGGDGK